MINDKEWEAAAIGMLDYPEIAYQISIRYNYPDAFSKWSGRLEPFFDFILMHPEYENLDNAIYESRTDGSKEQREHQIKRDITQLLNPYRGQIDDLKLGLDLFIDPYPFKFGVDISTKDLNILQQIETDAKSQGIETMAINKIAEARWEKSIRLRYGHPLSNRYNLKLIFKNHEPPQGRLSLGEYFLNYPKAFKL